MRLQPTIWHMHVHVSRTTLIRVNIHLNTVNYQQSGCCCCLFISYGLKSVEPEARLKTATAPRGNVAGKTIPRPKTPIPHITQQRSTWWSGAFGSSRRQAARAAAAEQHKVVIGTLEQSRAAPNAGAFVARAEPICYLCS